MSPARSAPSATTASASSASTGPRSSWAIKFLDATGSGTTADAIDADRVRDCRSSRRSRRRAAPTSACCRTAGAAATSRRRCSTRSTRRTTPTCCSSPARATTASDNDLLPVLSRELRRAERHRRRGDRQHRRARLVLELRRGVGASGCAGRRHPVDDDREHDYAFMSGTSMATPHVSGAAALVLVAVRSRYRGH